MANPNGQSPAYIRQVEVGTVTLKVANLDRSIVFYTKVIELEVFKEDGHTAVLGAGNRPIVLLEEVPGGNPLGAERDRFVPRGDFIPDAAFDRGQGAAVGADPTIPSGRGRPSGERGFLSG